MTNKKDELAEEDILSEEEADEEFGGDIDEAEEGGEDLLEEEGEGPDQLAKETSRMTGDVPVQVVAVLGKKTISVKELVDFKMGQVIDLARPVNEVVDLVAGGKLVAKGELVDIDGKMGVRIIKMVR